MKLEYSGRVWVFGDNVDTDMIIPSRFMQTQDYHELAIGCMADFRPEFASSVNPGDILVAGKNFGCGSSREHAPVAIRETGVSCIVAESFARIFFRNAVNMGFLAAELPCATERITEGDIISIDIKKGELTNFTKDEVYDIIPIPDFMKQIYNLGGLEEYIRINMK